MSKTGYAKPAVVQVGDGFEAATLAAGNTIKFWRTDASGAWQSFGQAHHSAPYSADVPTSVSGGTVQGATHAVFVFEGDFGGLLDSVKVQPFAYGASGWGRLVGASFLAPMTVKQIDDSSNLDGAMWGARVEGGKLWEDYLDPNASSVAMAGVLAQAWVQSGDTFVTSGQSVRRSAGGDSPSPTSSNPVTTGVTYKSGSFAVFTSPTGLNTCEMAEGAVYCPLSSTVQRTAGGTTVALGKSGVTVITGDMGSTEGGDTWASGDIYIPYKNGMAVLAYGNAITDGSITCTSSSSGFDCSNGTAGFSLNASSLNMRGTRG